MQHVIPDKTQTPQKAIVLSSIVQQLALETPEYMNGPSFKKSTLCLRTVGQNDMPINR